MLLPLAENLTVLVNQAGMKRDPFVKWDAKAPPTLVLVKMVNILWCVQGLDLILWTVWRVPMDRQLDEGNFHNFFYCKINRSLLAFFKFSQKILSEMVFVAKREDFLQFLLSHT